MSTIPVAKNIVVRNVDLYDVSGPSEIWTVEESPVMGLYFDNISVAGKLDMKCEGWKGTAVQKGIFAHGHVSGVKPLWSKDCMEWPENISSAISSVKCRTSRECP